MDDELKAALKQVPPKWAGQVSWGAIDEGYILWSARVGPVREFRYSSPAKAVLACIARLPKSP